MAWIISNAGTIFVTAVLLIIICLIVRSMIKKRKKGEGFCGGNCANCHHRGSCH